MLVPSLELNTWQLRIVLFPAIRSHCNRIENKWTTNTPHQSVPVTDVIVLWLRFTPTVLMISDKHVHCFPKSCECFIASVTAAQRCEALEDKLQKETI